MNQPAIFLERDGVVTRPIPLCESDDGRAYVEPWFEQALRFWEKFPSIHKPQHHLTEWYQFWETAGELKQRAEDRLAALETHVANRGHTNHAWWGPDMPSRRRLHAAVLHLSVPDGLFLQDAIPAIHAMETAGFLVCFAMNQGHLVDRGIPIAVLDRYHRWIQAWLRGIGLQAGRRGYTFRCPHPQAARCACRKPKQGLFREAVEKHDIDVSHSWVVDSCQEHVSLVKSGRAIVVNPPVDSIPEPLGIISPDDEVGRKRKGAIQKFLARRIGLPELQAAMAETPGLLGTGPMGVTPRKTLWTAWEEIREDTEAIYPVLVEGE